MGIRIGVQLYTLRNALQETSCFEDVFARVAGMGAQSVQVSGTCAFDSIFMRDLSQRYQLPVCATHSPLERIENDLDRLAEEHITFGCRQIGIGMMQMKYIMDQDDGTRLFAEFLNETAERLKPYSLTLGYHNHAYELETTVADGRRILDYLFESTMDNVHFIPDIYWIKAGGAHPEEILERFAGRVDVVHLKDYREDLEGPHMCELGAGTFDIGRLIALAQLHGVSDAVIELDDAPDPWQALEDSFRHLHTLGYPS